MADTRLSDLSAAGALSASDLFYVVQTPGSGGAKATGTQLLTLVGTTYLAKAGGTMTGALTIASGTLAASAPALDVTQTWNNSGVTFTGLKLNVTNTASGGSSLLADLQIGGVSLFSVRKDGVVTTTAGFTTTGGFSGFTARDDNGFFIIGSSSDVRLNRDAAAQLALRNGTTAQRMHIYGTYTDSSNYERLSLSTTAGSGVTIAAETLGTGADNLDITLTPTGTGKVKFPSGSVDQAGNIVASSFYHSGSTMAFYSPGVRTRDTGEIAWSSTTTVAGSVDVAMHRASAGVLAIDNGTAGTYRDLKLRNLLAGGGNGSYVQTPSMTVDRLADAATAGAGARAFVTDATATTFLSTVAGGGANKVPVVSDGTNWLIG